MSAPLNNRTRRSACGIVAAHHRLILAFVIMQFRGRLLKIYLTMVSSRAGLVMDPVSEGHLQRRRHRPAGTIQPTILDGKEAAKFSLEIDHPVRSPGSPSNGGRDPGHHDLRRQVRLAEQPRDPSSKRISSSDVIDVGTSRPSSTRCSTVTNLAEDRPVKTEPDAVGDIAEAR